MCNCNLTMAPIRIILKNDSDISVWPKENFLKIRHGLKFKITKINESLNDLLLHCMNDFDAKKSSRPPLREHFLI